MRLRAAVPRRTPPRGLHGGQRRAAAVPRDDPQGLGLPAHAAAAQRLLPVPPAPRRHRGPRAGGRLSRRSARAERRLLAWADAPGRRRRRHLHRRGPARRRREPSTPRRSRRRPPSESVGVLEAVRARARGGRRARRSDVERFAHGMTVATNALLEGRTARTALLATAGFTDVIELGRQNRPHLYRLCARRTAAAGARASCASARPSAWGPTAPLRALDADAAARARRRSSRAREPEAVAVVAAALLRRPRPRAAARRALLAELLPGVARVALLRARRHVPRVRAHGDDRARRGALAAARAPTWRALVARGRARSGLREPQIMQSSGGLTDAARAGAHAALTVLSGPGRRRRRRAAAGRARGRARRAVLRHGRHLVRRLPDRGRARAPRRPSARSPGGRWRCRRSTSTPSAPAAARSPGATPGGALRVGPGLRGRAARARLLRPRRRASRPSPTPTCCSGACSRTRRWRAACRSTARGRARRRAASRASSELEPLACARGDRARRRGRDARRAARDDASSAASTRAASR